MTALGVVLVHGIGAQTYGWADGIMDRLRARVREEVAQLLPGSPPPEPNDLLALVQVHWADVLQERQRALEVLLAGGPHAVQTRLSWRHALAHPIRYFSSRLRAVQARFIAEFIGDIIGYLDPPARAAVHDAVTEALKRLLARMAPGEGKRPLTLITHSLGSVIASNYVWDATKARRPSGRAGFHDAWQLENFFTIGSPMALFALQYGGAEAFRHPIAVEGARGRWVNIYDEDDPIGMPLKSLNDAYGRAVLNDAAVNAGAYLFAHGGYFTEPRTLAIISRKLAIDWAAANRRLPPPELDALYARYDQELGLG